MLQGVSSNAGKSVLTKAICRYLVNQGLNVTTFKPILVCTDPIELNGRITDIRMKASLLACRKTNITLHNNPIQVFHTQSSPYSNTQSPSLMVIEDNEPIDIWLYGRDTILYSMISEDTQNRIKKAIDYHLNILADNYDVVIIEGSGSPTDFGKIDISNYYIAKNYNVKTILVTKISVGGAVSSLFGTYIMLEEEIQKTISGFILNDLIYGWDCAIEAKNWLIDKLRVPCIGIFPHIWDKISSLSDDEQIEMLAKEVGKHLNLSLISKNLDRRNKAL
jgi:adenosylcobyric acid synthase